MPSKLNPVRDMHVTAKPVSRIEHQEDSVEKMTSAPVSEESIFLHESS